MDHVGLPHTIIHYSYSYRCPHFTDHTILGGGTNRFLRAFDKAYQDLKRGFLATHETPYVVKFNGHKTSNLGGAWYRCTCVWHYNHTCSLSSGPCRFRSPWSSWMLSIIQYLYCHFGLLLHLALLLVWILCERM